MPESLAAEQMKLEQEGKTVVGVVRGRAWLGLIAVIDEVRQESAAVVKALKDRGIALAMLTGDNQRVADSIAKQVGMDRVYAELLPGTR